MNFLRLLIMLFSLFSVIIGGIFCGHARDKNKDQILMYSGIAIVCGSIVIMLGIASETVNWLIGLVMAVGGYVSAIRRTREISREEARAFLAELVLPLCGIGWECTLEGMCLFCGKPGETYTVSNFTAENLWAMER